MTLAGSPASKRPIPAYAGEPLRDESADPQMRAYPRIRGGTVGRELDAAIEEGLSPHTRGNQLPDRPDWAVRGPIPAYAGEPSRCCLIESGAGAYPRIRGGTTTYGAGNGSTTGLSPHTRGNPGSLQPLHRFPGPIPAYAGEPSCWSSWVRARRAYPRIRGGTHDH